MRGDVPEHPPSDAPSTTCSRLTCSGGQHVLVHGVEAEFVVGQTVDRDAVRRPGLPRLPGSVRISNVHRDLASILGDDQIQLQARDPPVVLGNGKRLSATGPPRPLLSSSTPGPPAMGSSPTST